MTLHKNDFHGQSIGTAVTTTNLATSGDSVTSISAGTGGSIAYAADPASGGLVTVKLTPAASTSCYFRDDSFNSTQMSVSDCFYYAAAPSADMQLVQLSVGSSYAATLLVTSAGKITARNPGGTAGAGASALVPGHWYRYELQVLSDASAGTVNAQWYVDDGATQTGSISATAQNTRGGALTRVDRGPNSSAGAGASPNWYYTRIQAADGTTTPLGQFATQLTTPVVTLGTTTPATTGNSNGSQVVTWSAVANASSYEAWLASGTSPAQGDFTLKDSGVTSPYTFSGLAAGSYSFGIKAKA